MNKFSLDISKAKERYKIAEEPLFCKNLTEFSNHNGKLIRISDVYSGVWLEHSYDALLFSKLYPEYSDVAVSQADYFIENQLSGGKLPAVLRDTSVPRDIGEQQASYRQVQECVSFANICYETYKLTGNKSFLKRAYNSLSKWDEWLCQNRMTRNTGLIELFCEYDTGHDNALRFDKIPKRTPDDYGSKFEKSDVLPIIAPDMNAVFYGDRIALSKMAGELGDVQSAQMWQDKAYEVKEKMMSLLFEKNDEFLYDLDKNGNMRKFKTILMANVFQERMLDNDLFERIYERYFKNENEFYTTLPFPSTSVSDKNWIKNLEGNSWNYFSQTLVALRCDFWMEYYGKKNDYEDLLQRWLWAFTNSTLMFGQEFYPMTGEPSNCSPYYSSAILFYISAMRRLGYV